jgi:hypothetical protein
MAGTIRLSQLAPIIHHVAVEAFFFVGLACRPARSDGLRLEAHLSALSTTRPTKLRALEVRAE